MAENKTPEFEPPQACVQRVIKAVLPDNVQIGKDAKAAFSRSAGIFIMYLTACANDFCREAKRQTISAQDVMQAIKELEFGELEEPLREYLEQYRREASAKKQIKAMGGVAAAAKKVGGVEAEAESGDIGDEPDADNDNGVVPDADDGMGEDGGTGAAAGAVAGQVEGAAAQQPHADGSNGAAVVASPAAAAAQGGIDKSSMDVEEARPEPPSAAQSAEAPAAGAGPAPMDEDDGVATSIGGGASSAMAPAVAGQGGAGETNGN